MVKKKSRSGWGWWLIFTILILIGANLFFYIYYYSKLLPRGDSLPLTKPSLQPEPEKPIKSVMARVSVVIDDIGYALGPLKKLLKLQTPITYAVIPHLPRSSESARIIRKAGGELILHLPMEPLRFKDRFSGTQPGMLEVKMNETELLSQLEKNLIPGIVGVNNHMGSKFTQDYRKMTLTLGWIKRKGLFFLDSLTSSKSVGWKVAGELGIKRARRDIFLDNDNTPTAIEKEWNRMVKVAQRNGHAIAIGHLRGNTVDVLSRLVPKLSDKGVQLVPLSALVN